MTTSITDVATALESILSALSDVDKTSILDYVPPLTSAKVTLIVVPFGQSGAMDFAMLGRYSTVHAHRIPCQFWVKSDLGKVPTAMQRARDIPLQAMRLLAANPTLNGTVLQLGSTLLGNLGKVGQYEIQPLFNERDQIPYIVVTVYVPVEIREAVSF